MALIVVLSVFNGFEELILSLVNAFNPDLEVTTREGKVFHMDDLPVEDINNIPGIVHYSKVIEDNALFHYEDQQHVGTIKGVDSTYLQMTPLDSLMIEGDIKLKHGKTNYGIIGQGVAYYLGIRLSNINTPISIYAPKRSAGPSSINPTSSFNQQNVYPSGVFGVESKIDENYMLLPLEIARDLYDYTDEVSALEIKIADDAKSEHVAARLKTVLGSDFEIKNRIEQQQTLHKILSSEKWITFLILSFILIIATFNIIGSITLVILDKSKDIAILYSMGANQKLIKRIFLYEGLLITFIGAISGILLGGLIALLQQQFGIIGMGSGSFVVDAYPVKVKLMDFLAVFGVVMLIGWLTSLFPVRHISKNFLAADRRINPE